MRKSERKQKSRAGCTRERFLPTVVCTFFLNSCLPPLLFLLFSLTPALSCDWRCFWWNLDLGSWRASRYVRLGDAEAQSPPVHALAIVHSIVLIVERNVILFRFVFHFFRFKKTQFFTYIYRIILSE